MKFTALDQAAIRSRPRITKPTTPNEMNVDVPDVGEVRRGRGQAVGVDEEQRARIAEGQRDEQSGRGTSSACSGPRLRCLRILMKSSRKPTEPSPVVRNSSSSADAVGRRRRSSHRCRPRPGSRPTSRSMIACRPWSGCRASSCGSAGPSSRISWPKPCREKNRIRYGVNRMETRERDDRRDQDRLHATALPLCRDRAAGSARSATRSRPADRDALTSTTSPSASSARRMRERRRRRAHQLGLAPRPLDARPGAGAAPVRPPTAAGGATGRRRSAVDAEPDHQPADLVVRGWSSAAEFGHLAEHRPGPPAAGR